MQQWEYREVYTHTSSGNWGDSVGRSGKLTRVQPDGWKGDFTSVAPLLNRLGSAPESLGSGGF